MPSTFSKDSCMKSLSKNNRVRFAVAAAAVLLLFNFTLTAATDPQLRERIESLLREGKVRDVATLLDRVAVTERDAVWSYYKALSATDGDLAYAQMRTALASLRETELYCAGCAFVARYHLANANFALAVAVTDKALHKCGAPDNAAELLYLKAAALQAVGEGRRATKALRRTLQRSSAARLNSQIVLLLGDIEYRSDKPQKAASYYRKVARSMNREHTALALVRLAQLIDSPVDRNQIQHQLSAHFPAFRPPTGLQLPEVADNVAAAEGFASESSSEAASEEGYAVRVGVFSERFFAERRYTQLKSQGYTARLREEYDSDRRTYTVDIGRFRTFEAAERFRVRFERQTNDTYLVVSL